MLSFSVDVSELFSDSVLDSDSELASDSELDSDSELAEELSELSSDEEVVEEDFNVEVGDLGVVSLVSDDAGSEVVVSSLLSEEDCPEVVDLKVVSENLTVVSKSSSVVLVTDSVCS